MPRGDHWRAFVWGALLAGLGPGFLAGGVLPLAGLLGVPGGPWWPAVAQAHGYAQLAGFAGLMVFGVAFHFLPRLRGAPLAAPRLVPWVLALYGGGLALRVLGQTLGPFVPPATPLAAALRLAFGLSGPLALAGLLAGLAVLVSSALRGPALRSRPGFRQVAPFLAAGGAAMLLSGALNAAGTVLVAGDARWTVDPAVASPVVRLALLGWLVPVGAAFSARSFPLYLWARPPRLGLLRGSLALLLAGLLLSDVPLLPAPAGADLGALLQGLALWGTVLALNVLASRTPPPGGRIDPSEARLARATRWPLIGAYAWLAGAGLLLLLRGLAPGAGFPPPPESAAVHALGAGYVLLLIVGMGLRLLPGFAGVRARHIPLRWAWTAIVAAHGAALLRVLPALAAWLGAGSGAPPAPAAGLIGLSGVAGAVAVLAFGAAVRPALVASSGGSASAPDG